MGLWHIFLEGDQIQFKTPIRPMYSGLFLYCREPFLEDFHLASTVSLWKYNSCLHFYFPCFWMEERCVINMISKSLRPLGQASGLRALAQFTHSGFSGIFTLCPYFPWERPSQLSWGPAELCQSQHLGRARLCKPGPHIGGLAAPSDRLRNTGLFWYFRPVLVNMGQLYLPQELFISCA